LPRSWGCGRLGLGDFFLFFLFLGRSQESLVRFRLYVQLEAHRTAVVQKTPVQGALGGGQRPAGGMATWPFGKTVTPPPPNPGEPGPILFHQVVLVGHADEPFEALLLYALEVQGPPEKFYRQCAILCQGMV